MMDIEAWAQVVARLLAPGGRLYLFEGHPLDVVWDVDATEYVLRGDYFSDGLSDVDFGGGFLRRWPNDFLVGAGLCERSRARQWTLGQVMNSLVAAGLRLEHFEEHPDVFWGEFPRLPQDLVHKLPHTYSLLMRNARCEDS